MINILLEIEYDGRKYFGWQRQKKQPTIQGTIETLLEKIFQEKIKLYGAGRTDAQVSAEAQIANFKVTSNDKALKYLTNLEALKKILNAQLPADIYIKRLFYVKEKFHARYHAISKVYRYQIIKRPSPLRREFFWIVKENLDLKKIKRAVPIFLAHQNYGPFCGIFNKTALVQLKSIRVQDKKDEIYIRIEADRFLYKMVRRIVGALVDLGRNRRTEEELKNALLGLPHRPFVCAPAYGLILEKVKFPQRVILKQCPYLSAF
jgi:tRNA pseudouridine38-40 synthase